MMDQQRNNRCKDDDIYLFEIESKKTDNIFKPGDHREIVEAVYGKIPLEKTLKHLHYKYSDDGLSRTLIHRLYQSEGIQMEFYTPELVFMAIQKKSKLLKKLLVTRASKCSNLRRLVLWNLEAFTVFMRERDGELKIFVTQFEEEIRAANSHREKFQHSEKAVSMLATASLILKTIEKDNLKQKLKKFIARFNSEILNNLNHTIKIPFRRKSNSQVNSNYVVGIIEGNCSCFPTRKRVPYRIILQTIDSNQLKFQDPHRSFYRRQRVKEDQKRDLYEKVKSEIEKKHGLIKGKLNMNGYQYPFVRDQTDHFNITELTKFAKDIQKQEKAKQKQKEEKFGEKFKRKMKKMSSKIVASFTDSEERMKDDKRKEYEFEQNEQLKKFNATYIPTLPSNNRKSGGEIYSRDFYSAKKVLEFQKRGKSDKESSEDEQNIKIVREEPKWEEQNFIWGKSWDLTVKQLKKSSPFKTFKSLQYRNVVIKGGDDLRQEIICMQLIHKMESIIEEAKLDIYIKPYEIIVLSENSGMLQFVPNSISIDGLKKQKQLDLMQFYLEAFPSQDAFRKAKTNFIQSLVGSSILTYILRLKDRHNGNILIDNQGRIIHIDFGFILGMSPGGLNFQSSPFKFTGEYVEIMGGKDSPGYELFKDLFYEGMLAIRSRSQDLCLILDIMREGSDLDCFQNFDIDSFRHRFKLSLSKNQFREFCEGLVDKSYLNSRTIHYDTFQKLTNNIMP